MTASQSATGAGRISTLVAKDVNLYFKDRFYAFVTVLALVFFVAAYFLLPREAEDELTFGIYAPVMPPALVEALAEEGIELESQPSEEVLEGRGCGRRFRGRRRAAARHGRATGRGRQAPGAPLHRRRAARRAARGLPDAHPGAGVHHRRAAAGHRLAGVVLGPDLAGRQIAPPAHVAAAGGVRPADRDAGAGQPDHDGGGGRHAARSW